MTTWVEAALSNGQVMSYPGSGVKSQPQLNSLARSCSCSDPEQAIDLGHQAVCMAMCI